MLDASQSSKAAIFRGIGHFVGLWCETLPGAKQRFAFAQPFVSVDSGRRMFEAAPESIGRVVRGRADSVMDVLDVKLLAKFSHGAVYR